MFRPRTSSWCLSSKWVLYREALCVSQLVFFFLESVPQADRQHNGEETRSRSDTDFALRLLPVSGLCLHMDIVLSAGDPALIHSHPGIGDRVARCPCPGGTSGPSRCASARKYGWIYVPGFTLRSLRESRNPTDWPPPEYVCVVSPCVLCLPFSVTELVENGLVLFMSFFVFNFKSNLPLQRCGSLPVRWLCATSPLSRPFPFCYISVMGTLCWNVV